MRLLNTDEMPGGFGHEDFAYKKSRCFDHGRFSQLSFDSVSDSRFQLFVLGGRNRRDGNNAAANSASLRCFAILLRIYSALRIADPGVFLPIRAPSYWATIRVIGHPRSISWCTAARAPPGGFAGRLRGKSFFINDPPGGNGIARTQSDRP